MRSNFHLYILTCKASGKKYVGITTRTVLERFKEHVASANKGRKNGAIHSALSKYGADAFHVQHVASSWSIEALEDLEQIMIKQECTLSPNGYNLTHGGRFGKLHQAALDKASARMAGIRPHDNTINGVIESWQDPERRAARVAAIKSSMTPEVRAKQGMTQRGVKKSAAHVEGLRKARARAVECIDNGMTFSALVDAVTWLGKGHHSKIIKSCRSDYLRAYGYRWRYIDDVDR